MREKFRRYFAFFMVINLIFEICSPTVALALTGGPVQAEFSGFEPAGTTEMVDLFTGDFKYNIPLLDIDGYPINLSYRAGQNMESEASWVGLGWSLNPGVMNRMVKGLPDDFDGDNVYSETNIKPHRQVGTGYQYTNINNSSIGYYNVGATHSYNISFGALLTYNNYTGHSLEAQLEFSSSYGIGVSAGWFTVLAGSIGKGNGYKISSSEGVTKTEYGIKSYAIFQGNNSLELSRVNSTNIGTGTMINTRTGATYDLYFGSSASNTIEELGGIWTSSSGVGGSALMPTSHLSHNPSINHSFKSVGTSESSKWGIYVCGSVFFFTGEHGFFLGRNKYNHETELIDKTKNLKSYGYMNLENATESSLMDFNRFKDGVYMEDTPNGPYSTITNDVFSSTAQGMSTNFRPMRSDYGIVHDPKENSSLLNTYHGKELGLGGFYYRVKNYLLTWGGTTEGNWSNSPINNNLKFYKPDPTSTGDRLYEKAFFKVMGEPTPVNQTFENAANGENPVAAAFVPIGIGAGVSNPFPGASSNPSIKRNKRETRNTHIAYLNASDASEMGVVKDIKSFNLNDFAIDYSTRHLSGFGTPINRKVIAGSSNNIDHHLSEISVTRNDGSRYIYGIPVYNKLKKNVVFNASQIKTNSGTTSGLVPLNPTPAPTLNSTDLKMVGYTSAEVSHSNERGIDHYYHAEWMPPYAQSFLLTAIISSDYVDLTGDGPSDDDLGNYTLFNYTKTNEYKWRNPYCAPTGCPTNTIGSLTPNQNQALLDEGFRSDDLDDKAMYEYGVRDNWYLHSIETKNHVAEFEIDVRDDNCGVNTEDGGGLSNNSSYLLKQIRLYSKEDKIRASIGGPTPTPIKTIHFEYDYSLCKNVFNNINAYTSSSNTGKLTLKKVYFTYGNSNKASLSPYQFIYADNDHNGVEDANPDYHPRAVDRWGNYKANQPTGTPDNIDFPYAEQDQTKANEYAASWNLTSIITPSGAKTDVYYEADDYSYVQDEPSGSMLKAVRLYNSLNASSIDINAVPGLSYIYNAYYMVVDLSGLNKGISTTLTKTQADLLVSKNMFPTNKEMYFKCKTLLAYNGMYNNLITKNYWDYVPGYTPIEESGIIDKNFSGNTYTTPEGTFYKYAWVKLKSVNAYDDKGVNPISSAGWDLLKTHMPRVAWPGSEPLNTISTTKPLQTLTALISSLGVAWADHKNAMNGIPNKRFYKRQYAREIDYSFSWVRAYNPYKKKIGGTHRVKQIITNDNWNSMLAQYNSAINENSSTYGQKFEYTTIEGGAEISSGVASYEPIFGGDENSMHQPIKFNVNHEFAPNDHYFQETPYLEFLYPAALVGYSKVTVKNIDHEIPNSTSTPDKVCQIGKTVYEFYTSKDFPFIEKTTGAYKAPTKPAIIDDYTVIPSVTYIEHLSQGWTVKFNDMHGKVKRINIYGEDNFTAPISGVSYFYKSTPLNSKGGKQLVQKVTAINEDLTTSTEVIGRNIDVTTDLRESLNQNTSFGWNDYRTFSVCNPLGKGNITFINGNTTLGLRTAAITKVVQQYGILEKIESFNSKSKVTSENILWDKNSGEVLLTKTTNNLNQPVYSFNYPAYWMYPNMGNKFERDGLVYKASVGSSGDWDLSSGAGELDAVAVNNVLKPGDEVYVYDANTGTKVGDKFWIVKKNGSSPLKYYLVDANAAVLENSSFSTLNTGNPHLIKVIRPIERNQQAYKAGSVVTLNASPAFGVSTTQKVINSTATEYCEIWDIYKGILSNQQTGVVYPTSYDPTITTGGVVVNPYTSGQLGNWRPWRTFLYNTERTYSSAQPDVKSDGVYNQYLPFWNHVSLGNWQPIYNTTIAPSTGSAYDNWVVHNENTIYSPYGYLLEAKDAIGVYHSQRMGFNHTLPVLKADNAHMCEVGFDSFEDFGNLYTSYGNSLNNPQMFTNDHLGFYKETNSISYPSGTKPTLDGNNAHTGRQSLSFKANDKVKLVHDAYPASFIVLDQPVPRCTQSNILTLNKLNLVNDKYIVSFWVKSKTLATDYTGVFTFNIVTKDNTITSPPPNASVITLQKTSVIDGWQKFEYEVTLNKPSTDVSVEISVEAPSSSPGFYLDDFRVQPYNASMNTIVYDPVFLRVWAQLDDRNFATIYEYDNAGTLVRTKKETIKGIYTINEVRKSVKK